MSNTTGQQSSAGANTPTPAAEGATTIELYNDGSLTAYGLAELEAQLLAMGAVRSDGAALVAGEITITDIKVSLKPLYGEIENVLSGATETTSAADAVVTNNGGGRNLDAGGEIQIEYPASDLNILPSAGSGVIVDISF